MANQEKTIEQQIYELEMKAYKKRNEISKANSIMEKYEERIKTLKNQQLTGLKNPKVLKLEFKQDREASSEFDEIIKAFIVNGQENKMLDERNYKYDKEVLLHKLTDFEYDIIEIQIYQEYYDVEVYNEKYTILKKDFDEFMDKITFQGD